MTLGDIDYSVEPQLPELWLATMNKIIITKLNNRSGIGFSRFGHRQKFLKHTQLYKLNNIDELEFSVPYQIEINHELVRNPAVDQIRDYYLVKSIHNGVEEWFTINGIKKNMDADKDTLTVACRSLGYELIRQPLRQFKVVSQNLSSLLNGGTTVDSTGNNVSFSGILNQTLWSLDPNYDVTFDTIYRSIDISKATVLDALIQIAKTFNAIILFDTINRKINFQQLSNIGHDKGLKISYENYMKSMENESKSDEIVTRFEPIGKGGLTINSVSPNGLGYIDDFGYFLNGFTRDTNKTVLTHSPYMSDSLCGALLDYQDLMTSKTGQYTTLLNTLTGYQTQLTQKKNDMVSLQTTLTEIQKQIDIRQTTGLDASTYLTQQTSQLALIAAKQSEIDTVNANITSTNASIASLQATLSTSANFTNAQIQELIPFIFRKEYVDDKIADATELYNQALIKFQAYKTPQIIVKVDTINILEMIEEQRNWDKVAIGDDILIEYNTLGTSIKSKIIEMSFDHAEGNLAITVASLADLLRDEEKVYNMLYQGISAASTISVNLDNWNSIDTVAQNVNAIYNNGIDAAKMKINGGAENTIVINNRGLTSTVSSDANSLIRLNNGVLGFSSNGGTTFGVAISAQGIFANKLIGQILIGANLLIVNQSGSFSVDGNGVTIAGANLTITNGLPDSQITSATTWNNKVGQGIAYNGVVISTTNGLQITTSTVTSQVTVNASNGITIAKNTGTTGSPIWTNQFYVDTNGNIITNNITANSITANSATINNSSYNNGSITGSSINVNGNFTVTSAGYATMTGATVTGTINAQGGTLGNLTVTGTLSGGTISGTSIVGGSITSNTTINVTTDIRVGNNIYLVNGGGSQQSIISPGNASITFYNAGSVSLDTFSGQSFTVNSSTFRWGSETVATREYIALHPPIAVFG